MKKPVSIRSYLEQSIIRQSAFGFLAMAIVSISVTFFLGRYKMSTDLHKSALSTAQAFRSRILEGDIKSVESQIHEVLNLQSNEVALILNKDRLRLYKSTSLTPVEIKYCKPIGESCFDGYFGQGQILLPIYFDEEGKHLFGYLFLSKSIQIDWLYVFIIFSIFSLGYIGLLFGLTKITRNSSKKLSQEVTEWALRLKNNPKEKTPLSSAPFSELLPLKDSIEGLTSQIEKFENRASDKAKMLILRGIAHDVLSPIAQVQLYLATLESKLTSHEDLEDLLSEMRTSLKNVSTIASQMKSLNDKILDIEPINLTNVVEEEIEKLRKSNEIRTKSISINFSFNQSEVWTPISQIEVSRILQNLVQNAVHASVPSSEISIELEKQHNTSILSVTDAGCGIPQNLHKKVFEPDFTSKPATGTGLGLFIVKHICEQRDGKIDLISSVDKGTTVKISIPDYVEGKSCAL